jgi:hypothetical protein
MDNVGGGAYHYLITLPDVLGLIGSFPADDPDNPSVPWVFVHNLYTRMEAQSIVKGTQAVALVCINMGLGSAVLDYSTSRWQKLEIDIWVDPLRDSLGNVTEPSETYHRGLDIFAVLDSHLHRASSGDKTQVWGNLVTINGIRSTEPVSYPVPDGDGLIRTVCFWDINTFGNVADNDADDPKQVSATDAGGGADTGI